jgi:tRNA pseudouridine38-40 synthase
LFFRRVHNIKLVLEYDGTDYVGWQIQPNGPSVQAELEKALAQILQQEVTTIAAGRTDAGVHARGQVVNFMTDREMDPRAISRGLNAILPRQIVILSAEEAEASFHARYSAKKRLYRYYLSLQPAAIEREFVWYVGGYVLDANLMRTCADSIVGEHDFASFCKADSGADSFLCKVERAVWNQQGTKLVFEICADRFLHGMVRALVGTIVEVGRGYRSLEDFKAILEARDRRAAGMSAPARGLFLEQIIY